MKFFDTHVHFHFSDFDKDRGETIDRARQAGFEAFINVGTDAASSAKSLALAHQHEFIYASAGIHPHDAKDADDRELGEIEGLVADKRMVAIGEVGLDYFRNHSPKEKQQEVFRAFLAMHRRVQKPLIIHCRDAYEDMLEILKSDGAKRGVMHCFSSDRPVMEKFVEQGFYISFAGPLTYKKNDALREACRACPKDRLLLETDAPFLPPQSKRGTRNEPSFMLETAQTAADLHGMTLDELSRQTTANARKLFGL